MIKRLFFPLAAALFAVSCSNTETIQVYSTSLDYPIETAHPLTALQEEELRQSAATQLPDRATIVQVDLVGETRGHTAMVLWMHPPDSDDPFVQASYFDRERWEWVRRAP